MQYGKKRWMPFIFGTARAVRVVTGGALILARLVSACGRRLCHRLSDGMCSASIGVRYGHCPGLKLRGATIIAVSLQIRSIGQNYPCRIGSVSGNSNQRNKGVDYVEMVAALRFGVLANARGSRLFDP